MLISSVSSSEHPALLGLVLGLKKVDDDKKVDVHDSETRIWLPVWAWCLVSGWLVLIAGFHSTIIPQSFVLLPISPQAFYCPIDSIQLCRPRLSHSVLGWGEVGLPACNTPPGETMKDWQKFWLGASSSLTCIHASVDKGLSEGLRTCSRTASPSSGSVESSQSLPKGGT